MHFISEFSVFRFVVNNILVFKTDLARVIYQKFVRCSQSRNSAANWWSASLQLLIWFSWSAAMSNEDIKADLTKIEVTVGWLVPRSIHDLQSFPDLASHYWSLIRFSTLFSFFMKRLKDDVYQWTNEVQASFELNKKKMRRVPFHALLNFNNVFAPKLDVSTLQVQFVSNQEDFAITFSNVALRRAMNPRW